MDDWEADAEETVQKAKELLEGNRSNQQHEVTAHAISATTAAKQKKVDVLLDDPLVFDDADCDDPAERRRRKELIEHAANLRAAADLLPGGADEEAVRRAMEQARQQLPKLVKTLPAEAPATGPAESTAGLKFNTVAECQRSLESLRVLIERSKGKSVVLLELLLGLLKICAPRMDEKDLRTVGKQALNIKAELEKERRLGSQAAKKVYDKGKDQIKNYQAEMDMMYGGGGDDDEDDDDDDEDFM